MTPRTLKEAAQAGLILGFEWIARDSDGRIDLFETRAYSRQGVWYPYDTEHGVTGESCQVIIHVTDYPDLPPEKSLLRLSDIVEDKA